MLLIPTLLCPKAWEGMSGDETTRFCSYCKKHVHNLGAMSVSERLALLSSPAASICSRYKVAIRRPAPGKKESYMRHMLNYGAGVALASSALLVLCEMYAENEKRTYYRLFAGRAPVATNSGCDLGGWRDSFGSDLDSAGLESPDGFYVQEEITFLGITIPLPDPTRKTSIQPGDATAAPRHIDLDLDPVEINQLLQTGKPARPEVKYPIPPRKKKIHSLFGWRA